MQIDSSYAMLILDKIKVKVVCGAPNAKNDLLTVYAPPGATIPKKSKQSSLLVKSEV